MLEFIREAFQNGEFDPKLCEAYFCLIPKVPHPTRISEFRPISLCNVIYKYVTKCITMILRGIMPEIIAPTQSSFIKGRSTQDNIFLLQEVLHSMRVKKRNKVGCMIMKLNLEKAYNKVNWDFLEETLLEFKFPASLVALIMFCARNASTRILWNGEPREAFEHHCGLRQGDTLSPYLFVLCVERLSYLITEAVNRKKWSPIVPCRAGPALSHLLFADDLVLMGKATASTARTIRTVLNKFCKASGLKLNPEVKSVFLQVWQGLSQTEH